MLLKWFVIPMPPPSGVCIGSIYPISVFEIWRIWLVIAWLLPIPPSPVSVILVPSPRMESGFCWVGGFDSFDVVIVPAVCGLKVCGDIAERIFLVFWSLCRVLEAIFLPFLRRLSFINVSESWIDLKAKDSRSSGATSPVFISMIFLEVIAKTSEFTWSNGFPSVSLVTSGSSFVVFSRSVMISLTSL